MSFHSQVGRTGQVHVESARRLMLVTYEGGPHSVYDQVEEFLLAGGRLVQLRLKQGRLLEIGALARRIRGLVERYDGVLLIDDHVDLVIREGLAGVHLGLTDMPVPQARRCLGGEAVIGATVHGDDSLEGRGLDLADYFGVGPLRFTASKRKLSRLLGVEGVGELIGRLRGLGLEQPVYVIGGISPEDVRDLLSVGAYGVAVSSAIGAASHVGFATERFLQALARNV